MKGSRKEPDENGDLLLAEGEYGKDKNGIWYARPFGCHMGSLKRHDITEHDDGTITVSPSILVSDGQLEWHGYLKKGVWREC